MNSIEKIFSPAENRRNMCLFFFIAVMFCSNIKCFRKKVIYIFHILGIIDLRKIEKPIKDITEDYLLECIFNTFGDKKIIKKKTLRELTLLKDRETFNKYFKDHLHKNDLIGNKAFTIREVYGILQFWQGDDKWIRMESFSKGELADLFTNGKYEDLEMKMTNHSILILSKEEYFKKNYIKPATAKKFIEIMFKDHPSEKDKFYKDNFGIHYLKAVFYFFFIYKYLQILLDSDNTRT